MTPPSGGRFLSVNRFPGVAFFVEEMTAFGPHGLAVGLGPGFVGSNPGFALVKLVGFSCTQLAWSHTLVNTLLLVNLALINPGRRQQIFGRRCRRLRKGSTQ